MPTYLVCLKDGDEEHARELAGIFVAEPEWDGLLDDWSILPASPTLTDEWSAAFEADGDPATALCEPIILSVDDGTNPGPSDAPPPPIIPEGANVLPFRQRRRGA